MTKRLGWVVLFVILLQLGLSAMVLDYEQSARELLINKQKVRLDTPLIVMDGQTLVPLHDLAKALNGELVRNSITDEYFFKVNNQYRFVFTPNDKFMEFNNGTYKLTVICPELFGRLYVPLALVMSKLKYHLQTRDPNYTFIKEVPVELPSIKTKNFKAADPVPVKDHLPEDLNLDETTTVATEDENAEQKHIESKSATSNKNFSDVGPVFISTDKKKIYINNTRGFDRPRVYQVSYAQRDEQLPQVEILTTQKIVPEVGVLLNPRRLVIDLPSTVMDAPKNELDPNTAVVSSIRLAQNTPHNARIVIETDRKYSVETLVDRIIIRLFEVSTLLNVNSAQIAKVKKSKGKASSPLKGKTIMVMAGHGGEDPGAIGPRNTYEKDMTLDSALILKKLLLEAGAKVELIRESDISVSLRQRVTLANNSKSDATVSIHFNASKWKHLIGTETYYYKKEDYVLAQHIHKHMLINLKRPDREIRRARFYELNHTNMPCVLVESAYISNQWEEMLIRNKSFREKIAQGIFNGLEEYFESK